MARMLFASETRKYAVLFTVVKPPSSSFEEKVLKFGSLSKTAF